MIVPQKCGPKKKLGPKMLRKIQGWKEILVPKKLDPKLLWVQTFLGQNMFESKKFCLFENFESKSNLGPKNLGHKIFWIKKIVGPKNFGLMTFLVTKKHIGSEKWSNIFGSTEIFWFEIGSKIFLLKKVKGQKNVGPKKGSLQSCTE